MKRQKAVRRCTCHSFGPVAFVVEQRPKRVRVVCQSARPREKADQLESVPGRGSAAAVISLSLSRPLSRPERVTLTKVWEEAEVEGACKNEERGLTRCRGGSQGTWEMHSSRCQSPHQPAASVGPVGPRRTPLRPTADPESHRQRTGYRPARSRGIASLDDSMGYRLLREPPG